MNSRMLVAGLVLAMLVGGGSDGASLVWSDIGGVANGHRNGVAGSLPYGGLAALAQEAPSPTPTAVNSRGDRDGMGSGVGRRTRGGNIAALIAAYPWPQNEAWAVMQCESGGDPSARNGESIGLFEIHYPSHAGRVESRQALFDATTNIRVAYELWSAQGWEPWRWSRECHGL